MRKYFIAAAVAVAVFAMSAFAASLTVDGGVLQAGADDALTCGENADVTYTTQPSGTDGFAVNELTVTFVGDCDGNFASVAIFNSDPVQTGFGLKEIANNEVNFLVNPTDPDASVANVNSVSVLVKNTNDAAPDNTITGGIITG